MKKKIAISQSNYIPWKGYFDLIRSVDEFVFYDDVQYTKRDWRNRNKIKTQNGLAWLTIPVEVKGRYYQSIRETRIANQDWRKKHWQSIKQNYNKTEYFNEIKDWLEPLYLEKREIYLSDVNLSFIEIIKEYLQIETKLRWSSEFNFVEGKSERLIEICKATNAKSYLSGPAAKNYLDIDIFQKNEIEVVWANYDNYLEYEQLYPPFAHEVSIIDLLFNKGKDSVNFMKKHD